MNDSLYQIFVYPFVRVFMRYAKTFTIIGVFALLVWLASLVDSLFRK
jgi:hypothetical protein